MAKNSIEKIGSDYQKVWQELLDNGLNVDNPCMFDFDFYSSNLKKINVFETFLKGMNYDTHIKEVRTAFIFKGYELRASLTGEWTASVLLENLNYLCRVANQYDILFEGYGAMIADSTE